MFRIDPINFDETPEEPQTFPCACLDPDCRGVSEDAHNLRIGHEWFSADCKVAKDHPEVIRARELDAIYDRSRR